MRAHEDVSHPDGLWVDDVHCSPLRPLYEGPFWVLEAGAKSFVLDMGGHREHVTLDGLELAHLVAGT